MESCCWPWPRKAPEGVPNILFVLYDDTGQAAWSPYGGPINMPTLDRLAGQVPESVRLRR